MRSIFIISLLLVTIYARSQDMICDYWPAPCPNNDEINQARDVQILKNNYASDQEIKMGNRLREAVDQVVKKIATNNKWNYYELTEQLYSKTAHPPEEFEKRPPAGFSISYILITSQEKLNEWRTLMKQNQEGVSDIQQSLNEDSQTETFKNKEKELDDSLNYYQKLTEQFLKNNLVKYQQDLVKGNSKGIKEYESRYNYLQDKSTHFITLYNELSLKPAVGKVDNLITNKNLLYAKYKDSTVVLIKFNFNDDQTVSGITDETGNSNKLPEKKLAMKGVQYAGLTTTDRIEPHMEEIYQGSFHYPSYEAMILVGGFLINPDTKFYNVYYSFFSKNKENTNHTSLKRIPADQVQSINIHIQSNPENIHKTIDELDVSSLINIIKVSKN